MTFAAGKLQEERAAFLNITKSTTKQKVETNGQLIKKKCSSPRRKALHVRDNTPKKLIPTWGNKLWIQH